MISFFGALLGFIGSTFPELMKVYRNQKDREHELAILDRQIGMVQAGYKSRLEEVNAYADATYAKSLYKHARPTGVRWVDCLAGTVRPFITYAFFFLYACVKFSQWNYLSQNIKGNHIATALLYVWNQEDQVLFATVISFWFGQRMMSKFLSKGKG